MRLQVERREIEVGVERRDRDSRKTGRGRYDGIAPAGGLAVPVQPADGEAENPDFRHAVAGVKRHLDVQVVRRRRIADLDGKQRVGRERMGIPIAIGARPCRLCCCVAACPVEHAVC